MYRVAGVLFVSALMVAWRFPISFRPDDRFLALLARFFRSAEFLLASPPQAADREASRLFRWRSAFHLHEVTALPQRLRVWGGALPPAALGSTTREQIQSLTTSLQALSDRIQALLAERPAAESGPLERELMGEMQDWRAGVREAVARIGAAPGTLDHAAARSRVEARLARLEARVEEVLGKAERASLSLEEVENMYRLLGAYRGVSEALVDLVRKVSPVQWERLREARF